MHPAALRGLYEFHHPGVFLEHLRDGATERARGRDAGQQGGALVHELDASGLICDQDPVVETLQNVEPFAVEELRCCLYHVQLPNI